MCLILGSLFGETSLPVSAQQNQTSQQLAQEIEVLKSKVFELEKQFQAVENVEKMELQAKLAEANTKLLNAELAKFEQDLRDSNNKWLIGWILFFLAILSAVGIIVLREFRTSADKLITNEVEKNLNGFKDSLNELGILKNQLQLLEKEHAASTLESITQSLVTNTLILNKSRRFEKKLFWRCLKMKSIS